MQRYIVIVLFLGASLVGCKKSSYFQTNPNAPSSPISSSILTSLEKSLFTYSAVSSTGTNEEAFFDMAVAMQYNVGFNNHSAYSQSYQWVTTDMNDYLQITDAQAMIAAAGGNNGYIAIGKLFTAIRYYYLTNKFGDVPCSQADKLATGVGKPVYDPQKLVYQTILASLDTANNLLTSPGTATISGDFIYNGDLAKWRKFVNS
ncbi:MAG TPA: SusD/RagB family nutrient-binding outer membrane lipoprotein, partial [Puia sp.]